MPNASDRSLSKRLPIPYLRRRWISRLVAISVGLGAIAALPLLAAPKETKPTATPPAAVPAVVGDVTTSFLESHCYDCHDADAKKGGLDLTSLPRDLSSPAVFPRWVKVHDMIASGEMPPKKNARPDAAESAKAVGALAEQLSGADRARRIVEGRATYRRLTRTEYEQTLRDLFDLPDMPLKEALPEDGSAHGFDKISDALDISHVQLARYMEVADRVLTQAIATHPQPPPVYKQRFYAADTSGFRNGLVGGDCILIKDKQWDPALPLPEADSLPKDKIHYYIATVLKPTTSAVGTFRATDDSFNPGFQNFSPVIPGRYKIGTSVFSFAWDQGKVLPSPRMQVAQLRNNAGPIGFFDAPSLESREYRKEVWLERDDMILFDPSTLESVHVYNQKGRAAKHQGPGVAVEWLDVEGPIYDQWPPTSHTLLFGDLPIEKVGELKQSGEQGMPRRENLVQLKRRRDSRYPSKYDHGQPDGLYAVVSADPAVDSRRLLADFLPKAFRRPAPQEQVERYAAIVDDRIAAGDCFEDAMKLAYQAALCSPEFLFRIEPASGKLDDHAIASRLSYFFWNTAPDAELLDLASRKELTRSTELIKKQARRLLEDPRSERFVTDFLDQWLSLDKIADNTPDRHLYPEFRPYMENCMAGESRAYFRAILDADLGARFIVDSDFAMMNQELGKLYGIDRVPVGHGFSRVSLPPDSHRAGGFLTQASVLKVTANGTVTSPVIRGAWIMDRILGKAPDPPPPSVSAVDPDLRGATTIREQLDKHRNDASCAGCHAKIDPPGFALESYDVMGRWRDRYRSKEEGDKPDARLGEGHYGVRYKLGLPVDSTGQTADGIAFQNIDDFRKTLLQDERQLARNYLQRLAVYATGAPVTFSDRQAIEKILDKCGDVTDTNRSNYGAYRMRTLIEELVASELFTSK